VKAYQSPKQELGTYTFLFYMCFYDWMETKESIQACEVLSEVIDLQKDISELRDELQANEKSLAIITRKLISLMGEQ
jgi:hypothetical protein